MLPGLVIQSEPKRLYPAGKAVAHLVGYVSEVTEPDLTANRYPGAGLGSIVGQGGAGAAVRRHAARRRGRALHRGERARPAGAGGGRRGLAAADARASRSSTTIDLELQRYVDSIWPAGVRGAHDRDDPGRAGPRALFGADVRSQRFRRRHLHAPNWRALNTDEARPLLNRAIQTRYPPASPFKLAIAAMALKRGLIGLDTHMPQPCRGGLRLGNRVFRCWKKEGHGSLDLDRRRRRELRRVLLPAGAPAGAQRHHPGRRADGLPGQERDRPGERERPDLPARPPPTSTSSTGRGNWSPPATTLNFSIGQGRTPRPWST